MHHAAQERHGQRRGGLALVTVVGLTSTLLALTVPAQAAVATPAIDEAGSVVDRDGDVVLAWRPVQGATSYRVLLSTSPSFDTLLYSATTPSLRATPDVVLPSGTVYWRVLAQEGAVQSAPATGTFERAVARAPRLVGPGASGAVETLEYPSEPPVLRWQPVPSAKNYTVELSTDDTFPAGGTVVSTTRATSFPVSGLLDRGPTWSWRVRATLGDAGVTTEHSPVAKFVVAWNASQPVLTGDAAGTLTSPPPYVTDLDLRWSAVPGATRYRVHVATDPEFTALVPGTPMTVLTNRFSPARSYDNGRYYWKVTALDPEGNEGRASGTRQFQRAWGQTSAPSMGTTVPAAPVEHPTPAQASISDLRFSWDPVPRAAVYEVWVTSERSNFFTNASQILKCYTPHTSATPFDEHRALSAASFARFNSDDGCLSGLLPGTYRWRVRALDLASADTTTHHVTELVDGNARFIRSDWSDRDKADSPAVVEVLPRSPGEAVRVPTLLTPASCEPTSPSSPPPPCPPLPDTPELSWTAVAEATAGYWVEVALDLSFTNKVAEFHTLGTRLRMNGGLIDNDQRYYWRAMGCTSFTDLDRKSCLESGSAKKASFLKTGAAPTGLSWSASGDHLRFSWQEQLLTARDGGGTRGYEVEVARDSSFSSNVLRTRVDQPFLTTATSLLQDGEYFWRVRGVDGGTATLPWATFSGAGTPEVPAVPLAIGKSAPKPVQQPAASGASAPVLRWDAVPGTASYDVQVFRGTDLAAGGAEVLLQRVVATAMVPSTLAPGQYSWRVRRIDAHGNVLPWSAEPGGPVPTFSIGTGDVPLSSPAGGAVLRLSDRLLSWQPVPGAVRHRVQVSTSPSFSTTVESVQTAQTTFAPSGAYTPGTTYHWRVQPLDAANGVLAAGAEARQLQFWNVPSAPVSPRATASGASITLSWTTPVSNGGIPLSGFVARYRPTGTDEWSAATAADTARSLTLGDLEQGTSYQLQVAASNELGTGGFSAVVTATTFGLPSAPAVTGVTRGDRTAGLTWTAPTSNGGASITSYTVTASPGDNTVTVPGTARTATLTGLSNGTTYALRVAASNSVGTGPAGAAGEGVTPAGPPGAPVGASATPGSASATVSWSAAPPNGDPVTGYTVTASPGGATCTTTGALSCTVSGLSNGTSYSFTVTATNAVGAGATSAPTGAVTPAALPGAPGSASASSRDRAAQVTWTSAPGNGSSITGYVVTVQPGDRRLTAAAGGRSLLVDGLENGSAYSFAVHATSSVGAGPAAVTNEVVPAAVPSAPTGADATAGNGSAAVTWRAAADNGAVVTGYTVTASPGGRTCSTTGRLGCSVLGLANGVAHTFTVTAANAIGSSAASSASPAVVPSTSPGAPFGVTATSGNAAATVTWTAAPDNGDAVAQYAVTAAPGGSSCTTTGGLSCTVRDLVNGTSYSFQVTATNRWGPGPASAPSAGVVPAGPPTTPSDVVAAAGDGTAAVSWSGSTGNGTPVTGYTATASPGGRQCTTTGALGCTVTGLTNGTGYVLTVTATSAAGASAASAPSARVTPTDDADGDGVRNGVDNCRGQANADQADLERDGVGDVCDEVDDVANSDPLFGSVRALRASQITLGCSVPSPSVLLYCPTSSVDRSSMAIFLARGLAGSDSAVPATGTVPGKGDYDCRTGGTSVFTDVAPASSLCRYVHRIAAAQVTLGSTATTYGTSGDVLRDSMAIFVARAVAGGESNVPDTASVSGGPVPGGNGTGTARTYDCRAGGTVNFSDVPVGHRACKHVHYLWARGVIGGTSATTYDPNGTVIRLHMAKFLTNAFRLPIPE